MLTIKQILKATPKVVLNLLHDVKITSIERKRNTKTGNPIVRAITYSMHDAHGKVKAKPEKYKTSVEGLMGAGSKVSTKYVKVSCSCPHFWSVCEVALNKQGAADIKYSNGELPHIKNPAMIPSVCKHLSALLTMVATRGW